jgi:16S rRNA (guanine527-N7)-methyltransferase
MNGEAFREKLRAVLQKMGIVLEDEAAYRLARFNAMVYARNRTQNLTAIDEADSPLMNFADSLAALPYIEGAGKACDIGSGAGFPGIVLAIARPGVMFTMLEAQKKRAGFLCDAVRELGLENARAVHIRAEDAGRDPSYRERFDVVAARALAAAPVLCEYAMPLLSVGGRMIAYKGALAGNEAQGAHRALQALGGAKARTVPAGVPGLGHTLFIAEKTGQTPDKYPRRAGVPKRKPIA